MTIARILIVEDDLPSRQNLELILRLEGYEIIAAADGASAWSEMREHAPDLVVCDVMMPGMSGFDLLARVRADAALEDLPFVFLTALGDMRHLREGMNLGADDYLAKPFEVRELVEVVGLRLRQSRRKRPVQDEKPYHLDCLSRREREVLDLIGRGLSSKEIAAQFNLSLRTIDAHRANLLRKLQMPGSVALIQFATRLVRNG